ncbi:MAG: hypothetical protein ABI548_12330 [Polyangiaceae bacterium]
MNALSLSVGKLFRHVLFASIPAKDRVCEGDAALWARGSEMR